MEPPSYVAGTKVVDMPDQDKRLLEGNAGLVARHVMLFPAWLLRTSYVRDDSALVFVAVTGRVVLDFAQ
jgi:hypothetical protein